MNKPRSFLLAMVQMHVEGGKKQQNIAHAVDLIAEAAAAGAELALLPECLDLGWCHPSSAREAEPIPAGASFKVLARAAETNRIALCAGLTEEAAGEIYNTAVYITSKGEPGGIHRKINELDIGFPYYCLGDGLNVMETEFGRAGIMICADAFAEDRVLTRSLGYMGADFILSPSAWAVPADHDNELEPYGGLWRESYMPPARHFRMPIIGVSNVGWISGGPWKGRKCIGCSLAVDSSGEEVLQGPYGADAETILYTEVRPVLRPARGTGWAERSKP